MPHVTYTGRSDLRVLSAKDFKSLGVEDVHKIEFPRGQKVEVPDAVAKVLTEHPGLKSSFELEATAEVTSVNENPEPDTDKTANRRKSS